MNLRIDRNFSWNINSLLDRVEKAITEPAATVSEAAPKVVSPLPKQMPATDIGVNLIRHQLQSKAVRKSSFLPVRSLASVAKVSNAAAISAPKPATQIEPFNPNVALGFFGQLAGGFVSSLVGNLTSKIPANLVGAGIQIASSIFGGDGGQKIDPELAGYLQAAGIDPRGIAAARIFYNSPNAIPGYATTLGTDIHFGDQPDPRYWVAAANLQRLIDSGASPEEIQQAQEKLRATISDFALLAHETNHVAQYERAGTVGFASTYASDFAGGFVGRLVDQAFSGNLDVNKIFDLNDPNSPLGGAYRGVSYEQESYGLEDQITSNLESQYASLLNY